MMLRKVSGLALVQLLAIAFASGALADEDDPARNKAEARRHFERGTLRFDEARYREAIEDFQAVYEITGAAEILYNIGRCHEELGQAGIAVTYYERYLEKQGDAADTAEVKERIERLATPEPDPDTGTEGDRAAVPAGLRLGVSLGAAFPITGEWDRTMVPFCAVLHLPLLDWLFFTGTVGYAGFAGEKPRTATGYPTSAFDLGVGLTGFKSLSALFSLFCTIGAGTVFLLRDRHETAYWIDPRIALGLAINFFESWSATVEATASYGPVFNPKRTQFDPWDDPAGPTADAGGRVGVFYSF